MSLHEYAVIWFGIPFCQSIKTSFKIRDCYYMKYMNRLNERVLDNAQCGKDSLLDVSEVVYRRQIDKPNSESAGW